MARLSRNPSCEAKERLLRAAENVFARVGYERATIRAISLEARLSVAMINYYFGGKGPLYRAVLEHSLGQSIGTFDAPSRDESKVSLQDSLHQFVLALLSRALDQGTSLSDRLMARELAAPSFALPMVVDRVIRPRAEMGHALVRRLVGPDPTDTDVHRIEQSVVAQCLHYTYNRPLLDRLYPGQTYGPEQIAKLARHIAGFSLAAMAAFRQPIKPCQSESAGTDGTQPVASRSPAERPPPASSQASDTRVKVLEAALELFALVGFRHVTVREICQRAKVNIAMVNYHFGGKEELYRAVLDHTLNKIPSPPPAGRPVDQSDREKRLKAFVFSLLSHVLDEERSPWSKRLIAREMVEPSFALDILVNRIVRPGASEIHRIVRAYLGEAATDLEVQWHAESIAAQCLYYQYNRPVLAILFPTDQYGPAQSGSLTDHITRFSQAALLAFGGTRVQEAGAALSQV